MNPHLILIVEEDSATRSFLADQLVADGYEILLAENRGRTRAPCSQSSLTNTRSSRTVTRSGSSTL